MICNISKLDPKLFKIKTYYLKEKKKSVSLFSLKISTLCFQKDHPFLNYSSRKKSGSHTYFQKGVGKTSVIKDMTWG